MNYTENRYTSHDGLSLYYREYGHADDLIICLPGLTRNSKDFHELASHLAGRYRVLCPDLRGRGQSDRDPKWRHYHPGTYVKDIWTLMDELDINRVTVIGTSLGGLMAMIMAAQRPQCLAAIIMNDIGPEIDPVGYARIKAYAGRQSKVNNWQEAAEQCRQTYALAIPDMSMEFWDSYAHRCYKEADNGIPVPDADSNIGEAIRKGTKVTRILTGLRKLGLLRRIAGVPIDPWDSFRAISMPCLVVRGGISDILSEEIVSRMLAVKTDLQRATIPNRGHAPMLDEPESLRAIDDFLNSLQTSAP